MIKIISCFLILSISIFAQFFANTSQNNRNYCFGPSHQFLEIKINKAKDYFKYDSIVRKSYYVMDSLTTTNKTFFKYSNEKVEELEINEVISNSSKHPKKSGSSSYHFFDSTKYIHSFSDKKLVQTNWYPSKYYNTFEAVRFSEYHSILKYDYYHDGSLKTINEFTNENKLVNKIEIENLSVSQTEIIKITEKGIIDGEMTLIRTIDTRFKDSLQKSWTYWSDCGVAETIEIFKNYIYDEKNRLKEIQIAPKRGYSEYYVYHQASYFKDLLVDFDLDKIITDYKVFDPKKFVIQDSTDNQVFTFSHYEYNSLVNQLEIETYKDNILINIKTYDLFDDKIRLTSETDYYVKKD